MDSEKILRFKVDTKHRNDWFTGVSFSHPAKMSLPLQMWIIDNYTKEGETILDPMAGSGTVMVACSMGRNVICVELEKKFCDMMQDNWEKVKQRGAQLGYSMGTCQIINGDARNLEGLLADKIVTSPPYSDISMGGGLNTKPPRVGSNDQSGRSPNTPSQLGAGKYDKCIFSPPYAPDDQRKTRHISSKESDEKRGYKEMASYRAYYSQDPDNIGNPRPYGQVDKIDHIITSPPYGNRLSDDVVNDGDPQRMSYRQALVDKIITSPPYENGASGPSRSPFWERLANDPTSARYGRKKHPSIGQGYSVDAILTSPPYEASLKHDVADREVEFEKLRALGYKINPSSADNKVMGDRYSGSANNIGNLKSISYLEAMLAVYKSCFAVLKPQGLLILVTKNFIRNKQEVRLDSDTISLCEQAGFSFVERHYRKLTSQSFWRTIYYKKYPEVEPIKYEDCLIFQKGLKGLDESPS